jgi:dipeptidyl aminopeptidase/acylaminoacyl peptidase
VVLPNVRGSSGYGRTFLQMDDGVKRVDAVNDLHGLLDWISHQPSLDRKRVAIMGGSYGGFMTLAALASFPKEFIAGISVVGISDLTTFLRNTSNYRRDLRRAEYGDERDPKIQAAFDAVSPLRRAKLISVPLFVIQGANDPRVPESEATQIVSAVRANGKDVWSMTAQDEGHGFRKKANVDRMRLAVTAFLRQHLLAPAP